MADNFTTNLNLTKPEVGASTDTWGNKLNDNADAVDALFDAGPYLKVAKGGTGAGTAANARTNLGLGTMATQNANAVTITGGTATFEGVITQSVSPYVGWRETDATTDNKYWLAFADGQQWSLRAYNDAASAYGTAISITRSGISPSVVNIGTTLQVNGSVVYHAGNISSATITEGQISGTSVLARLGSNQTVTGSWTISGSWNFSTAPKVGNLGALYWGTSGLTGGVVTLTNATPAASGTPGHIVLVY
jgi:hypothetical protein